MDYDCRGSGDSGNERYRAVECLVTLPESMSRIEQVLRASEQAANGMVMMLMSGTSVIDLILSILIMGCLTGIAEELFSGGCCKSCFTCSCVTAYSHLGHCRYIQCRASSVFGFVPRMLIGAFLGYLAWWSGSLWLPAMAHALNNSLEFINQWQREHGTEQCRCQFSGSRRFGCRHSDSCRKPCRNNRRTPGTCRHVFSERAEKRRLIRAGS